MNQQAPTNPLPPAPPTADTPPISPVARKRSEYPAWWETAAFAPWGAHIFREPINAILTAGVSSFAEFHRNLQTKLQMRIPEEHLRAWLDAMGPSYSELFSRRRVIKLDPAAHTPPPTSIPVQNQMVIDEETLDMEIQPVANPHPPTPPLAPGQRPHVPTLTVSTSGVTAT